MQLILHQLRLQARLLLELEKGLVGSRMVAFVGNAYLRAYVIAGYGRIKFE